MKKNKIVVFLCMVLCILLIAIISFFSTTRLILKGKVLNENTFEINCSQVLGYKYRYDTIMTGPKCKVEVKDDSNEWRLINDKEYFYLNYQNEVKENAKTSWVVGVSDDCKLDSNNEYRITHEFVVFPRGDEGNYRIISKVIYIG